MKYRARVIGGDPKPKHSLQEFGADLEVIQNWASGVLETNNWELYPDCHVVIEELGYVQVQVLRPKVKTP